MKKLLFSLITALVLPLTCSAQILTPILRANASVGTNIQYQGYFKSNPSGSISSVSGTYTCASTSNRVVIVGEYQNTSGITDIVLSDTGGQASGATVLLPLTTIGTIEDKFWNAGCASGSNTFTITEMGGPPVRMLLEIVEYSGISSTNTGGSVTTVDNISGNPFTISGSASQSGMLAFVFAGMPTQSLYFTTTASFNYRATNVGSTGDGPIATAFPVFDNINTPSGPVNFTMTASINPPSGHLVLLLIPGIASISPNWGPYFVQSNSFCNTSTGNAVAFRGNVTSGDLLIYSYKSENTGSAPTTVTDTLGTSYTLRVNKQVGTSNAVWVYTGIAPSSGANTVTANGSTLNFPCSQVTEIAGPVGSYTDNGGQTTSSGTMTWTQTVSTANSIVYAVCGGFSSADLFQMTGIGFSATSQANGGDAIGGSWARTVSTSSTTPIFTINSSGSNVCASIVIH